MKIYLVERTVDVDYDEYESMVVYAKSPSRAKLLPPLEDGIYPLDLPENLSVTYIGMAPKSVSKERVIHTSAIAG